MNEEGSWNYPAEYPIAARTLQALLDRAEEFVREDMKEIRLPVNPKANEDTTPRPFDVAKMALADPEDWEGRIPYILIQLLKGKDGEEETTAKLRFIICTYDRNREAGKMTLLHTVEKLRFDLLRAGTLGNAFVLKRPLEYLFINDDTGAYHLAEIHATYSLPEIERDVLGLHDAYYE